MMVRMTLNVRKVDVARYVADCLRREDPPWLRASGTLTDR